MTQTAIEAIHQVNRFFGEEFDRVANKAFGLSGDYTIFLMANTISYNGDINEVLAGFDDDVSIDEIITAVSQRIMSVELPLCYRYVGLKSTTDERCPKQYGIVDFSQTVEVLEILDKDEYKLSAVKSLELTEKAWHQYANSLELGIERERAFEVYENIRTSRRVGS